MRKHSPVWSTAEILSYAPRQERIAEQIVKCRQLAEELAVCSKVYELIGDEIVDVFEPTVTGLQTALMMAEVSDFEASIGGGKTMRSAVRGSDICAFEECESLDRPPRGLRSSSVHAFR